MKYLVVVDMQNDFVYGALGSKDAQSIVENVKKYIDIFDFKTNKDEILQCNKKINV